MSFTTKSIPRTLARVGASSFVAKPARNGGFIVQPGNITGTFIKQGRTFSLSSKIFHAQREYKGATEIPASSYIDDGTPTPERIIIPVVQPAPAVDGPLVPDAEVIEPIVALTPELHEQLNPTMKGFTLMGKVVVVTGGARGLGNNMARACIEAGAKVLVIFDARQDLGDEAAAALHAESGIPVVFYNVDVRNESAIQQAVDSLVEKFGAPDVVINSAGIADSNIPAETYDTNMWRRLIDINLNGSFMLCQSVARAAITAQKPLSVILIASMSGSIVNFPQEQSAYNASKAGVVHLGKSLAAEWAKYNIRVNCISPGYMDTALNKVPALDAQKVIWTSRTPQHRLGAVGDLNGLAVFLGSDSSSFMTGSNVIIDGGYTLW